MINNAGFLYDLKGYVEGPFKARPTELAFFSVVAVHSEERTIDIKYAYSTSIEYGVRYLSPAVNSAGGIDFVPSPGDVGIVAKMMTGTKVVIGFLSSGGRSAGVEVASGDQIWKSLGMSLIKQDTSGNILVTSESGAIFMLASDGRILSTAPSGERKFYSMSEEVTESLFRQDFFRDIPAFSDIEFESDPEKACEAILNGIEIEIAERTAAASVVAGETGLTVTIPGKLPEPVVYQIQGGSATISFTESGNIEIAGDELSMVFNKMHGVSGGAGGTGSIIGGSATFASGLTHRVSREDITATKRIVVSADSGFNGTWSVESFDGYFDVTSTASESNVPFAWFGFES